jgi:hypothetical protein
VKKKHLPTENPEMSTEGAHSKLLPGIGVAACGNMQDSVKYKSISQGKNIRTCFSHTC